MCQAQLLARLVSVESETRQPVGCQLQHEKVGQGARVEEAEPHTWKQTPSHAIGAGNAKGLLCALQFSGMVSEHWNDMENNAQLSYSLVQTRAVHSPAPQKVEFLNKPPCGCIEGEGKRGSQDRPKGNDETKC
ncbi:hypothetical protein AOLI_G00110700 [Acnodon oligacanthus]